MAEIIPIVNEADEIIGSVEKENFDKSTGKIYRTVTLFLFDKQGRILIQRRAFSKKTYAGKWDLAAVAGHVRLGESYAECVARETEEELGLSNLEFFEGAKEFTEAAGGKRRFTQVFWAFADFSLDDLRIPPDEVAEVKLLTIAELREMFLRNSGDFADYNNSGFEEMSLRISELSAKIAGVK